MGFVEHVITLENRGRRSSGDADDRGEVGANARRRRPNAPVDERPLFGDLIGHEFVVSRKHWRPELRESFERVDAGTRARRERGEPGRVLVFRAR